MKKISCQSCNIRIPPGGHFYISRTEIASGFDGFLPDAGEDPNEAIRSAMEEIAEMSENELLHDVYQEISLILCPECRIKFRNRVLSMIGRPGKKKGKLLRFPRKMKKDKDKHPPGAE